VTDDVVSHEQPDLELIKNGCAKIANTNSAAKDACLFVRMFFMVLLPPQMIEGSSDKIKPNIFFSKLYVKI